MKAAFAAWGERIAPVFDVAHQLHVVEIAGGRIVRETQESLTDAAPMQRALRLAELGVGALVCGAISRALQIVITSYGIRVVPYVAGDTRKVIQAWLTGRLDGERFAMPGCYGRGRGKLRGGRDRLEKEVGMPGRGGGGAGRGGGGAGRGGGRGAGLGRGGGRRSRMGGPFSAEPGGPCVCPRCGYQTAHQQGEPCVNKQCPNCGIPLTRQ